MLRFNELRIDSLKNLIIDVSIIDMSVDPDKSSVISQIKVGIGSNTELQEFCVGSTIFDRMDGPSYDKMRGFRLVLPLKANNNYTKLVYVSVAVDTGLLDIPCSVKTSIEGMVYDKCMIMNNIFSYIKKSDSHCKNLDNYANYILQIKGLELAVESGRFDLAHKYWNTFFNTNAVMFTSNCNCHG